MNTNELYQLAELGKTSGGFLHDIVNHVTAVTLSMSRLEERAMRESELLLKHAAQAAHIRKSVEDFARGIRAYLKHGLTHCFFTPAQEIHNLVELFRCRAEAANIVITTECDPRLRLYGNRLRFAQIISNILSNAIDALCTLHRAQGNIIAVSCERAGAFIKVAISDTAAGIPEHVKKHLFEPFISSKGAGGTGLGLASTQKIVEEDFSGRIEVETTPGGGSTFILFLRTHIGTPARTTRPSTTPTN